MAEFKDFQDYFLLCDKTIGQITDWQKKTENQEEAIKRLLGRNDELRQAIDDNNVVIPPDKKFTTSDLRDELTTLKNQLSPRPRSPGYR